MSTALGNERHLAHVRQLRRLTALERGRGRAIERYERHIEVRWRLSHRSVQVPTVPRDRHPAEWTTFETRGGRSRDRFANSCARRAAAVRPDSSARRSGEPVSLSCLSQGDCPVVELDLGAELVPRLVCGTLRWPTPVRRLEPPFDRGERLGKRATLLLEQVTADALIGREV